ncbi:MAG: TonB-dependent receptor [Acinetobacter sp.]|nr:TonB-dependent receptor [Acinetobacter sp.]
MKSSSSLPYIGSLIFCGLISPMAWANSSTKPKNLETIVVHAEAVDLRQGMLKSAEVVATESIKAQSIERTGASNLNEAVDKRPGIAVQVECSICNVRNVLLNNLPGRYTTLLVDGIPIYSSVSSAYGLDSVSTFGVERIDVARGAGASLIAPEALAGTVSVQTKKPTKDQVEVKLQGGNFNAYQADAYVAKKLNENNAITANVNYHQHDSVDNDGDKISEFTGYQRLLLGAGWYSDDVLGFDLRGRFDYVDEERGGGALGRDYAAIKASRTGNPFDFSRGQHGSPLANGWINPTDGSFMPYDKGKTGFSEWIQTNRYQATISGEKDIGRGRLRLAFGAAKHKQDSFYEGSIYKADQNQYYSEISYQQPIQHWTLTTGVNYRYEDLKSHGETADSVAVRGVDNYRYRVPAVFVQGYRTLLDDQLEVKASLRFDHHNEFGSIFSPRFNALYHHNDSLSSRLSLGQGFRAPTSFFEQDHGILDTIRIERQLNKPEISHNLSYALHYANDRFAITSSYNFNRIKNFALLDAGQQDAQGNPITVFSSSPEAVTVQGLDTNMSYQLTPAVNVSLAAEVFRYKFPAGTLSFARPNYRAFSTLNYAQGNWDLFARATLTGPMNLQKFHDDGSGQQHRYNFDGSPKLDKSPAFVTVDVRGQYQVNKHLKVFVGADNVLDYTQSDRESFLWINADGEEDVTHLWGPNRGRYVYGGLAMSF